MQNDSNMSKRKNVRLTPLSVDPSYSVFNIRPPVARRVRSTGTTFPRPCKEESGASVAAGRGASASSSSAAPFVRRGKFKAGRLSRLPIRHSSMINLAALESGGGCLSASREGSKESATSNLDNSMCYGAIRFSEIRHELSRVLKNPNVLTIADELVQDGYASEILPGLESAVSEIHKRKTLVCKVGRHVFDSLVSKGWDRNEAAAESIRQASRLTSSSHSTTYPADFKQNA